MCLKIITLMSIFVACSGMSLYQNEPTSKKVFRCGTLTDRKTMAEEKAVSSGSEIGMRSFLLSQDRRWPHGVVPYEMDPTFSPRQVQMIQEAMQKFSAVSCVRWVRRYKQRDYVSFVHAEEEGKCNSAVGRRGGEQGLNLGDDCFMVEKGYQGAIAHEMMHAIGFIHEQQRIDRDCYVNVARSASESKRFDYGITPDTDNSFPYDFGSIMHYGANDFLSSKGGERLGNYQGEFTQMDIMKLRNMYCGGKTFCELQPGQCKQFQVAQQMCKINNHPSRYTRYKY